MRVLRDSDALTTVDSSKPIAAFFCSDAGGRVRVRVRVRLRVWIHIGVAALAGLPSLGASTARGKKGGMCTEGGKVREVDQTGLDMRVATCIYSRAIF